MRLKRDPPTGFRIGTTNIACRAVFDRGSGEYLIPVERDDGRESPRDGFPRDHWRPP